MQRTEIVRQDDKNIIDPFLRHTKSGPTDVAIIDGAEVLTYQELWRLSNTLSIRYGTSVYGRAIELRISCLMGVDLIVLYLAIQAMAPLRCPSIIVLHPKR